MKQVILTLTLLTSFSSLSATAEVFCKNEYGIKNVLSSDGWKCRDSFFYDAEGTACFTGNRGEAIDILNSLNQDGYFYGADGQSIYDAHYKGRNEISYTYADAVNDLTENVTLKRCTSSFFQNN